MAFTATGLYSRVRTMLPEVLKFLIVGGLGTVIDLGGAAVLNSEYHFEPLAAKAVSVTLATVFTYVGSRFWTFKERENQSMRREAVLFFVLNVVGLLIAEAVIGLVTYVMGLRGSFEYNAASFIGTGLGTIFRFYAYRKWVFLDPETGSASTSVAAATALLDYPPWELDQAFLAPAQMAATAPLPLGTPAYPSPWETRPAAVRTQPTIPMAPAPMTPAPMARAPQAPAPMTRVPMAPAPQAPAPQAPAPKSSLPRPRSSGGGRHRKT